jgi:diazepam-binding inhibitor (GABA receptor modulating acyl-CoA-binding protein)
MSLQERFEQAVAEVKEMPERPGNMALLKLYALYKQAAAGDAAGERPGISEPVSRAKWDAWDALRGTSNKEAMQRYIDLVEDLKG